MKIGDMETTMQVGMNERDEVQRKQHVQYD